MKQINFWWKKLLFVASLRDHVRATKEAEDEKDRAVETATTAKVKKCEFYVNFRLETISDLHLFWCCTH